MKKKEQLLLINRICDEFESRLRSGAQADIEEALASARLEFDDRVFIDKLLFELIVLRFVYCEDSDSTAALLKSGYPEYGDVIEFAKQQLSGQCAGEK